MEANTEAVVKELTQKMSGARFWMYLIGILMIIGGVAEAISIEIGRASCRERV